MSRLSRFVAWLDARRDRKNSLEMLSGLTAERSMSDVVAELVVHLAAGDQLLRAQISMLKNLGRGEDIQ